MADDELLADTNRLLGRVVEITERQRVEQERFLKGSEERIAQVHARAEEAMKERLKDQGLPPEAIAGTDEDWERRSEEATRRTKENIETLREKDEAYKAQLLQELQTQSDLLRRIAEKLEA